MRKHVWLFYLVTMLFWASNYAYVPIQAEFAKQMGADAFVVGLITGAYGFAQIWFRTPVGIVSDKIRRRKPFVVAGALLGALGALGMFVFRTPVGLMLMRGVAGMSASMWVGYSILYASYFDPKETIGAMGRINAVSSLGQMLAMLLGGVLAQAYGLQAAFLLAAVAGLAGTALSLFVKEVRPETSKPVKVSELFKVGLTPVLLLVSSFAVLQQIIVFSTNYGFTPVWGEQIGMTAAQMGTLTMLAAMPTAIASFLCPKLLAPRLGERGLIALGFSILGVSTLLIPMTSAHWQLYALQFLSGFGGGTAFPMLMAMSIQSAPVEKRGAAMGFFQAIYSIGMFIGPVLTGALTKAVNLETGFVVVACIGFVGAVAMLIMELKKRAAYAKAA